MNRAAVMVTLGASLASWLAMLALVYALAVQPRWTLAGILGVALLLLLRGLERRLSRSGARVSPSQGS